MQSWWYFFFLTFNDSKKECEILSFAIPVVCLNYVLRLIQSKNLTIKYG